MKKFSLLFCVVMILSLIGCTQQASMPPPVSESIPQATVVAPEPATEAVAETVPIEQEVPDPTMSDSEIPKSPVIETKYYTLPLPDEWKETCHYSVVDEINVTLREKDSYEAFDGGKLCTLMLMPTDDNTYKDFPDYELLCALDTPEGSFYVVALFPTDVQFNEETAEVYNVMAEGLMQVLWGIQPKDGIEMAMP